MHTHTNNNLGTGTPRRGLLARTGLAAGTGMLAVVLILAGCGSTTKSVSTAAAPPASAPASTAPANTNTPTEAPMIPCARCNFDGSPATQTTTPTNIFAGPPATTPAPTVPPTTAAAPPTTTPAPGASGETLSQQEAVKSAQSYLQSGHFSHDGLVHQLESPYGEGFTHAQAVYGVSTTGV